MKDLVRLGAVIAGLAAVAAGFVHFQQRKGYALKVGEPAPVFHLPVLDGEPTGLEGLRGRVVLVNLWATWCPPCLEEMPSLERLHKRLKDDGLVVLGISADKDEKDIRDLLAKQPVSFPILRDPEGAMADRYRATGYPETYLVDKQGVLRATWVGPVDWDAPAVVAKIRGLMAS